MKAILMTATGSSDVLQLQDIAEPEITRPTQIKVKLHAGAGGVGHVAIAPASACFILRDARSKVIAEK